MIADSGTPERGGLGGGPRLALATVCAVLFLTFLDTTIVSVALSSVQTSLHAGVTQLQWTVNAYALVFASLMLMAGNLSDRFGRKRLMLIGLGIFCAGSALGALAPNVDVLIAARAVMGAGAAASEPGTLSVIRHLFPDSRQRARALGVWAAVSALALAAGPVLGGFLVGISSWRGVFWFNLAYGVAAFVAAAVVVPESRDPLEARLDFLGFALVSIGLAALTFGIILGETDGYGSAQVIGLFIGGALLLMGFVLAERRVAAPMLDLSYLRIPAFSGALGVAFAAFFGIFAIFFFTALYLQIVVNYSGYRTALVFLPMAAAMIVAALVAGRAVGRYGPRLAMTFGCLLAGSGILGAEAVLAGHVDFAELALALAVTGAGFGAVVVPVTSVALAVVAPELSGMASSATNTSRELGAVFGVAVLGELVNANLVGDLTRRMQQLHLPDAIRTYVISKIEGGGFPSNGVIKGYVRQFGPEVTTVLDAAYRAFRAGLEVALLAAGAAMLAGALVAWGTLSSRRTESRSLR